MVEESAGIVSHSSRCTYPSLLKSFQITVSAASHPAHAPDGASMTCEPYCPPTTFAIVPTVVMAATGDQFSPSRIMMKYGVLRGSPTELKYSRFSPEADE